MVVCAKTKLTFFIYIYTHNLQKTQYFFLSINFVATLHISLQTTVADPNPEPFSEQSRMRNRRDSLEYGIVEAPGYHTLASVMGTNPEYAIFRKFSSLNAFTRSSLSLRLKARIAAFRTLIPSLRLG